MPAVAIQPIFMYAYGVDVIHCIIFLQYQLTTVSRNFGDIRSYVTLSHLRSKEITGIHKPCIPHSNDSSATTEYKTGLYSNVTWEHGGHQVYTSL